MNYLLDTHAVIWIARGEHTMISPQAASILNAGRSVTVFISAVSAWEMATKNRTGKLPGVEGFLEQLEERAHRADYGLLGISVGHGRLAGQLKGSHKDPFDRILAAQALLNDLVLLSSDRELDAFGVKRVW